MEASPLDRENFKVLAGLRRQHPHLRVLVSVGGWLGSRGFSDLAATAKGRRVFVESAVDFVRRHDLDGFDVDWEYPGLPGNDNPRRPEDGRNFTALLADLRAGLDAEGAKTGRRYLLTIAAAASPEYLQKTEMGKAQVSLDFVNLMTYDFRVPGSDPVTGHHANLYATPADDKNLSADRAVRDFLAAGVPPGKLVMGVPFYGRAWGQVEPRNRGLYQPGKPTKELGEATYPDLAGLPGRDGWVRAWDETAQAPYLWKADKRIFVTYDDPESLRLKCRYVLDHHLGGVMFWEYFADRTGTLLGTLADALGQAPAP